MHDVPRARMALSSRVRTWMGFRTPSVEERAALTAEVMRSHRCGPNLGGTIEVMEHGVRCEVRMDRWGSGGRRRRGDPEAGTGFAAGTALRLPRDREAHHWSFGQSGVAHYCTHCAVSETISMDCEAILSGSTG